jgi:glutaredoxin
MKIVYTQDPCPACVFTKAKLTAQGIPFREVKIGEDISKEDFMKEFPGVRSVPYVVDEQDLK